MWQGTVHLTGQGTEGKGLCCRAWPYRGMHAWLLLYGLADVRSPFSPPPPLTPVTGVPADKSNFNQWHRSIDFLTLRSGNKTSLYDTNVLSVTQFTKQQVLAVDNVCMAGR